MTYVNLGSGNTNCNTKVEKKQLFYFKKCEVVNKLRSADADIKNAIYYRQICVILVITTFPSRFI